MTWRLAAVLAAGMGLLPISARGQAAGPTAAPRIAYLRPEDGKATLAFATVPGANWYRLRVRRGDGNLERLVDRVEVAEYTIHGLRNGRTYRVALSAVVSGKAGPWSREEKVQPSEQPPWQWLHQAFASDNPTRSSNPFTMVHGNESEAELRRTLRAAYDGGFEGITIHPYNYADFLGPGQWSRWRILIDQARRLGLCLWQQDDRNYPSGSADGRIVAAHPEFARWVLAQAAERTVQGPGPARLSLAPFVAAGERLVAISAFQVPPIGAAPLDLTERVASGQLVWEAPAGSWRVFVVKAVRDPDPHIDFMSAAAVDAYLAAIYDATYREIGAEFGRTWKGFFSDEAPVSFSQIDSDFLDGFDRARGYSLRRWLPCLWNDLGPGTLRTRCDYRDFVRELNAATFFGRSREWCHRHGVAFIGHVIEDHEQDFRRLEFLDMGGFDHIFDQWYRPDPDVYWRQSKMASSVSHYTGARADLAMVEHFAATSWRTGLSEMKRMMDWTTAMGLNQIVPCGLDTQDPPVWEDQPEFWLHGKNPQWPYFRAYQAAANRLTMLMRGGRHIASALVLDNTESAWVGPADEMWRVNAALSQAHIDYDNVPYSVFADPSRARFEGGQVRVGKESYRSVVLPGVDRVPAEVVERLCRFRDAGGIVVALGRVPKASCRGEDDERVRVAVSRLWGIPSARGAALVAPYEQAGAVLRAHGAWDVRFDARPATAGTQARSPDAALLHCHRRLSGRDIYFVANTGTADVSTWALLRGAHGVPELWDPVTGAVRQAGSWSAAPEGLRVHLELGDGESVFVVIDPRARPLPHARTAAEGARTIRLVDGWTEEPTVRPYTRTWRAPFTLPAGWHGPARLSLRGASEVVALTVNGRETGFRFCAPYVFEVGAAVRPGANVVSIRQVERWRYNAHPPTVDDPALTYDGVWQSDAYAPAWKQTRHYTDRPGASATYTFQGKGVAWIGERNSDRGTAEIYIDGKLAATVDTYNGGGPEEAQVQLWRSAGLPDGEHTLKIVSTGRKGSPSSRGAYIGVDGLAVEGAGTSLPWQSAEIVCPADKPSRRHL